MLEHVAAPIGRLIARKPTWANLKKQSLRHAEIDVHLAQGSGTPVWPFEIEIYLEDDEVCVRERTGTRLPAFCPERHINPDGSLCIGLDAGTQIGCDKAADRWWAQLKAHLLLQDTASRTGEWPSYAALSHGRAGETQLIAEALGRERGMFDEVEAAMNYEGPIHRAQRFIAKRKHLRAPGTALINGRGPCLCGRMARNGKSLLRLFCNRGLTNLCLVRLEDRRRMEEKRFWKDHEGKACCGTMRNCPLRNDQ